jgi:hypothetical protein
MRAASQSTTIRFQSLASNGPTSKHAKQPANKLRMTAAVLNARFHWLCKAANGVPWSDLHSFTIMAARAELASLYASRAE